jgi:hypothetical protein
MVQQELASCNVARQAQYNTMQSVARCKVLHDDAVLQRTVWQHIMLRGCAALQHGARCSVLHVCNRHGAKLQQTRMHTHTHTDTDGGSLPRAPNRSRACHATTWATTTRTTQAQPNPQHAEHSVLHTVLCTRCLSILSGLYQRLRGWRAEISAILPGQGPECFAACGLSVSGRCTRRPRPTQYRLGIASVSEADGIISPKTDLSFCTVEFAAGDRRSLVLAAGGGADASKRSMRSCATLGTATHARRSGLCSTVFRARRLLPDGEWPLDRKWVHGSRRTGHLNVGEHCKRHLQCSQKTFEDQLHPCCTRDCAASLASHGALAAQARATSQRAPRKFKLQ